MKTTRLRRASVHSENDLESRRRGRKGHRVFSEYCLFYHSSDEAGEKQSDVHPLLISTVIRLKGTFYSCLSTVPQLRP
jgi:hypothetical protein